MKEQAWRLRIPVALAALGLAGGASAAARAIPRVRPLLPDGETVQIATTCSHRPIHAVSAGAATFPVGPELAAVGGHSPFHDISAAYAAGYTTENEPCVASPDG